MNAPVFFEQRRDWELLVFKVDGRYFGVAKDGRRELISVVQETPRAALQKVRDFADDEDTIKAFRAAQVAR